MRIVRVVAAVLCLGVSPIGIVVPSRADPIVTPIVLGLGFTGTAATVATAVGTIVLTTGANYGLSLFARSLRKRPQPVGATISASEVAWGTDNYRVIPIGRNPVKGQFIYAKGVGYSNNVYHLVYKLADWECQGLAGIIVDGVRKSLSPVAVVGTEDARYEVEGYGSKFIVKFFRGAFPQLADTELIAASSDTLGQTLGAWTSEHRGDGMCSVHLKLTHDPELFQRGIPDVTYELDGAKLYDRRKDSTAGGSGAHRWDDPTTWAYSNNPVVGMENYERGFWRGGVRLVGKDLLATDLLTNHYVASANICDEVVAEGTGTGSRYTVSTVCSAEAEHRANLESFRLAMAADMAESGGLTGPLAGASYTTVMTIYDRDILADGEYSYTPDSDDPWNAVTCKWVNPETNWQSDDFPMLTNSDWEQDDGGRRIVKELNLSSVTNKWQAQRIQELLHKQSRMTTRTVAPLPPRFDALEIGDWITRVFERKNHPTITAKVIGKSVAPDLSVMLTLLQCAAGNFAAPTTPPITTLPTVIIPHTQSSSVFGFSVAAGSIETTGQSRPTLVLTWTPIADPSVASLDVEYRLLNNAASTVSVSVASPLSGGATFVADILAGADYQVRARPRYTSNGVGVWSEWRSVSTSTHFTVMSARISHDTHEILGSNWSLADSDVFGTALGMLQDLRGDQVIAEDSSRDVMRVANATGDVAAQIVEERRVRVTENSAVAALAESALATASGVTAGGLFRIVAESGTAGSGANITLQTRIETTGTAGQTSFHSHGMVLQTKETSPGVYTGSVAFLTDQFFIITDVGSGVTMTPFAVVAGEVYIQSMNVGGVLKSSNYEAGHRGFNIDGITGDAEFNNITASGNISALFQDGIPTSEVQGSIAISTTAHGQTFVINGSARRTAGAIEYEIEASVASQPSVKVNVAASRMDGIVWAPQSLMCYQVGSVVAATKQTYSVVVTSNGELRAVLHNYNSSVQETSKSVVVLGSFLSEPDSDPLFENQIYDQSKIFIWKDTLIGGLKPFRIPEFVNVGGVPTPVVGMRVSMWAAAGGSYHYGTASGNAAANGGPGGFVQNDVLVSPREKWHLLVGGTRGVGLGGQGIITSGGSTKALSGGGGSFLWRGDPKRSNLEMVAGAGSAGVYYSNGAPGGASGYSGGNNPSLTDMRRCMGYGADGSEALATYVMAPGGGGYEGGTDRLAGSNYIKTPLNSVNQSSAHTSGAATTLDPPQTSNAIYTTHGSYGGDRKNVGTATNGNTLADLGKEGGGMIAIQFLTSV